MVIWSVGRGRTGPENLIIKCRERGFSGSKWIMGIYLNLRRFLKIAQGGDCIQGMLFVMELIIELYFGCCAELILFASIGEFIVWPVAMWTNSSSYSISCWVN